MAADAFHLSWLEGTWKDTHGSIYKVRVNVENHMHCDVVTTRSDGTTRQSESLIQQDEYGTIWWLPNYTLDGRCIDDGKLTWAAKGPLNTKLKRIAQEFVWCKILPCCVCGHALDGTSVDCCNCKAPLHERCSSQGWAPKFACEECEFQFAAELEQRRQARGIHHQ